MSKVDPNIVYPGKDPDFVFPEEEPVTVVTISTIDRRLSDDSLKALSSGSQAIMERLADLETEIERLTSRDKP